jgi:NodT family efflux transporter outer membrane factor (OMF) lipoprotein
MRRRATLPLLLALAACTVGPDYRRPSAPVPPAFKELAGWKIAAPADAEMKGPWWAVFHDPVLDALERQVVITNQTVKQAEAAYAQARALVAEAQAGLFPTLAVSPDVTRNSLNSSFGTVGIPRSVGKAFTDYSLQGSAAWDLDVWGRIRRQVEAQQAAAAVGAADLANAVLSAQIALATDYFNMRAQDSLADLLRQTIDAYARALVITENQYNAGTASRGDVVTAEAQLKTAQAQLVGVGVQRAQFEHAIAVLTGHAPAELSIPPAPLPADVPVVPPGLPSTLLERRPDIAAAERAVAQANANIGVAVAAYYPDITLSAAFGYSGSPIQQLFTVANRVWSLGAAASEPVLEGGLRLATVAAAHAGYDAAVAAYRQTVLSAFQQVEDNLAALRILADQAVAEAAAVAAAQRAVDVALNEYRAGTVAYTAVITEQTLLLADQQTALAIQQSRLLASVALIGALGGGWRTADLPPPVRFDPVAVVKP